MMQPTDSAIALGHPSYVWRFGQERRLALIRRYASLDGGRVLDIGCGLGLYASKLAPFCREAYGVDLDGERLALARQSVGRVYLARAEALPFVEGGFDMVLLHEVLEHVEDDRRAVEEAFRCARPGGRIVVFAPNRLYPFETHGAYLGGRYIFGLIPLVNYLPGALRRRFCPHVRTYTVGSLRRLFADLPGRFIIHTQLFAGYDNIASRYPRLASFLRRVSYRAEGTPLRLFGLSHFLVMEKAGGGAPHEAWRLRGDPGGGQDAR